MTPCPACRLFTITVLAALAALAAATVSALEISPASGPALLRRFCGDCHFEGADEGGVVLDRLLLLHVEESRPFPDTPDHVAWVNVWRNIRAETMPPADAIRPTPSERRALLDFVSREVLGVDPGRPDPGRVVLRRLNRVEYANTVRDLTGIDMQAQDDLPADDTGYGFDTIGEVLTLSPLLLEKYADLAARVGDRVAVDATAVRDAGDYPPHLVRLFPEGPPPADPATRPDHLRRTLRRLAERAFRRPVDEATVSRLAAVASDAGSFERGVAHSVTAVLAAPRFLYRVEEDVEAGDDSGGHRLIDEFSLASRLSYFLWSTMPDDELFTLAREGRLRAELARQVRRMLADDRTAAIVGNFVGQWLQTRDVEALPFDVRGLLGISSFEEAQRIFSPELRRAMRRETEMLFAHVLREGLPATELLLARRTFLNEKLSRFYGIPGVTGEQMQLVDLPTDIHRGGILTHGSFLVVTSNPTRTSPVKRGLFILDNLLGTPAPPAPADVPPLERAAESLGKNASMREMMKLHRADARCASCHARMDPLGLASSSTTRSGDGGPTRPPQGSIPRVGSSRARRSPTSAGSRRRSPDPAGGIFTAA